MSNELAMRAQGGFLALNNDDFFAALANEAEGLKGGGDGKPFMKFSGNDGGYSYGADDNELPVGTQLVMNPRSYQRGWVIWVGGEVVFEDMTPLEKGQPLTKVQLPDKGPYGKDDGPVEQYTIDFKTLDTPLVEMVFQANNVSKRRALAALLKDFGRTYKTHPGALPIVEIDSTSFEAKGEGGRKYKKYAPTFKIVDWISQEELLAIGEGSPADYAQDDQAVVEEEVVTEELAPEPEPAPAPAPAPRAAAPAQRAAPRPATRPAAAPAPAPAPAPAQAAAPVRRGRF